MHASIIRAVGFASFLICILVLAFVSESAAQRSPYKYIYSLDYPVGQKEAYLEWVRSIADDLQANEEVTRVISYDNYFGSSPQRVIEFEFQSMEAAARYFEVAKVNRVLQEVMDRGVNASVNVYRRRDDYTKGQEYTSARALIKYVFWVDYPVGQKQAYLDWVGSISDSLQAPDHVEGITSYDNYFGASPNRMIEFEFETMDAAAAYFSDLTIADIMTDIVNHGVSVSSHVLSLRSDYKTK